MSLGETIRALRVRRGMDQADLAKRLGIKANSVSDWETGKTSPRHARLAAIADALGVTVRRLVA